MTTSGHSVKINKLRFHGHHGVTEKERILGVQLEATILAELGSSSALTTDKIEDTVDYIALGQLLIEVNKAHSYHTLEALIQAYGEQALDTFPLIRTLHVTVAKPNPPTALNLNSVAVRLSFHQSPTDA